MTQKLKNRKEKRKEKKNRFLRRIIEFYNFILSLFFQFLFPPQFIKERNGYLIMRRELMSEG